MLVEGKITFRKKNITNFQHCTKYFGFTYPQPDSIWEKGSIRESRKTCLDQQQIVLPAGRYQDRITARCAKSLYNKFGFNYCLYSLQRA